MNDKADEILKSINNSRSYVELAEILRGLLIENHTIGLRIWNLKMIADEIIVKATVFGEDGMAKKVGYGIAALSKKL